MENKINLKEELKNFFDEHKTRLWLYVVAVVATFFFIVLAGSIIGNSYTEDVVESQSRSIPTRTYVEPDTLMFEAGTVVLDSVEYQMYLKRNEK